MLSRRALLVAALMSVAAPTLGADLNLDLFSAIGRDNAREVRAMLLKGADANAVDPDRGPALVFAAQNKSFDALRVLAESPLTDLNIRNAKGETALMYAAVHGQLDAAKLLVARGAEINHPGWTPLHYAATGGSVEMVAWLLENDAYIDAESANDTTPLMLAARQRQLEVIRVLIEKGADPTVRNHSGLQAADYLEARGEREWADWMRRRARRFEQRYGTREQPVPAPAAPSIMLPQR